MSIYINGTSLGTTSSINYNGTAINSVNVNSVKVWQKVAPDISLSSMGSITITIIDGQRQKVTFSDSSLSSSYKSGTYKFESSYQGSLDPRAFTAAGTGDSTLNDDDGDGNNYSFSQTISRGSSFTFYSGVHNNLANANGTYTLTITRTGTTAEDIETSWTTQTTIPGTASLPTGKTITVTYPSSANAGGINIAWFNQTNSTKTITKGSTVSFPFSVRYQTNPQAPNPEYATLTATMTITWPSGAGAAATASYSGWTCSGRMLNGAPAFSTLTKSWR